MNDIQQQVANYLTTLGVTMEYGYGAQNYPKWADKMNAFRVTIKRNNSRFDTDYFTGANAGEPNLTDVLHSLLSDLNTIVGNDSFEDWCHALGYNEDSITDLATYKAIVENSERLEVMFSEIELSTLSRLLEDY